MFGFSKLDVMFGRRTLDEVRLPYSAMAKPGVTFRQETITSIDPVARRVVTSGGSYDADVLVVSLGADFEIAATPGLTTMPGTHEFYTPSGAEALRDVLSTFAGGSIVISVLGSLFKCPPAPFEAAFMLHDLLVQRGVRDRTTITVTSPLPAPIPVSPEASAAIRSMLAARDISRVRV